MRGHGTTIRQTGVRLIAIAALPLGLMTSIGLGAALVVRLRALLPVDASTATVDRVVEIGVVGLGLALLAWLVWGLAVATLCAAARTVGVTWRAGERAVARHAPGVVRRVLVVALGAGLGVAGAVTAHATAPADGLDVGWSPTTSSAPVPGPSTAPPPDVSADPHASRAAVEQTGADGPSTVGGPTAPGTSAPGAATDAQDAAAAGAASGARESSVPATSTTPAPGAATAASPGADSDAVTARPVTGAHADATRRVAGVRSTPTEASGTATTSTGAPATPDAGPVGTAAPGAASASTVVVVTGDSLWGIAQRALGADATDQEVAAEWPRWYAANADVIGADPDLVVPGQVLRVPGTATPSGGVR
ncbi:LysM peptidoglycan-binding domain-containing protein [Cellulomonas sp. 179-A 4D5 NHS]|uniref:LysM peptidoglycan-binding domain-containing protein n=1 Tax=Cellulomonas sp. 179-A 4D5 NHS TaxID=3142378 RepID=UPI00399F40B4